MTRAAEHFSQDFFEARSRFLAAAERSGARLTQHSCPAAGPKGEALTSDCAWIGPAQPRRLLVTISGTHGTEGLCGSGVQCAWLEQELWRHLPEDTAALCIHAINPYGFAWQRRETEENVDLNRNFLDFSQPLPGNLHYPRLHPLLCLDRWDEAARGESWKALERERQTLGPAAFQQALSGGQFTHPNGLFYGGSKPTWARRTLEQIFAALPPSVLHVAVIDYHTGLGPYGYGERILDHRPGSPGYERAATWFDGDITSAEAGTSASAPLVGTNGNGIMAAMPRERSCTWMALEFGTRTLEEVFEALRASNWLWREGERNSPQGREVLSYLSYCFAPEDPLWRQQVWERAMETQELALRGLADA